MAISVNWDTGVIFVPKADTTLIQASPEVREFDVFQFHQDLRTIQASEGQPYPDTHNHIVGPVLSGTTYADFVEVLNPYTVEFEDGQYTVKVTGANNNLADVKVANQTSIATENSAGLITADGGGGGWDQLVSDYLDPGSFGFSMAQQEYDGRIYIDTVNGASGTTYPLGTRGSPVDNFAQALVLASTFRCDEFWLKTPLTLDAGATGYKFVGVGESAVLDINGQALSDVEIERCYLTGNAANCGYLRVIECWVDALANCTGIFKDSILLTWASIGGAAGIRFLGCASGVAGGSTPYLDFQGTNNATLELRRYSGGIELRGASSVSNISSVESQGQIIFDSTCIQGSASIRGIGMLTDNSGAGFTVDSDAYLDLNRISANLLGTTVNCP